MDMADLIPDMIYEVFSLNIEVNPAATDAPVSLTLGHQ